MQRHEKLGPGPVQKEFSPSLEHGLRHIVLEKQFGLDENMEKAAKANRVENEKCQSMGQFEQSSEFGAFEAPCLVVVVEGVKTCVEEHRKYYFQRMHTIRHNLKVRILLSKYKKKGHHGDVNRKFFYVGI